MFIFINVRSLKMIVRRRFHRYSIFLSLFIYNHLTGIFVIFSATKNHRNHIFESRSRRLHRKILSPFTGVFQFLFPTNDPNKLNYISLDKYPKFKGFTVDCKYKLKFVVSLFSFLSFFSAVRTT